eukprot:m.153230 g.153230  ORF g.153230 m.153230 type:complete len:66 (+) comp16366_c2_seq57:1495-1692(+)
MSFSAFCSVALGRCLFWHDAGQMREQMKLASPLENGGAQEKNQKVSKRDVGQFFNAASFSGVSTT